MSAIFVKFEIVVCKLFQFGRARNLSQGTSWNIHVGTINQFSKFFFSETGRRKALVFGMQHLLVDPKKIVNIMLLRSRLGTPRGSQVRT